jgi:hypothetical protein
VGVGLKPAAYPRNDEQEEEAILIFKGLINRKYVRTDIKSRDKNPNSDGTIEIVDETTAPIGKLEVQIRGLSLLGSTYYCDDELVAYGQTTSPPFLIIIVDLKHRKAFWRHIRESKLEKLDKSFAFRIREEDEVSSHTSYLQEWTSLVQQYQEWIRQGEERSKINEFVSKYGMPPGNMDPGTLAFFQSFGDSLNRLLETDYSILKERRFPNLWKLGIAIQDAGDSLAYGLYEIERGSPLLPVTRLSQEVPLWRHEPRLFQFHLRSGKDIDAQYLALSTVRDFLLEEIERRGLPLAVPELAAEYLYNSLARHHIAFDLSDSAEYNVGEVRRQLNTYFFRWVVAAIGVLKYTSTAPFVDLSSLIPPRGSDIEKKIVEEARRLMMADLPPFLVKSSRFDLGTFIEALDILERNKIETVTSHRPLPDFDRVKGQQVYFVHQLYSEQELSAIAFDHFVAHFKNVGDYQSAMSLPVQFGPPDSDVDLVMVNSCRLGPWAPGGGFAIGLIFLKLVDGISPRSKFLSVDNETFDAFAEKFDTVEFSGGQYRVTRSQSSLATNLFKPFPLLSELYDHLQEVTKSIR